MEPFFAGSIAACCASLLVQPLDVLKTRREEAGGHRSGPRAVARSLVADRGWRALWSGATPTAAYAACSGALFFGLVTRFQTLLAASGKLQTANDNRHNSPLRNLMAGAAARSVATVLCSPLMMIKTWYESSSMNAHCRQLGLVGVIRQTVQSRRLLLLGLGPTLARDVPWASLQFTSYQYMKSKLHQTSFGRGKGDPWYLDSCAAAFGGTVATFLTHPIDVVRTRLQLSFNDTKRAPRNAMAMMQHIVHTDGPSGLFRGFGTRALHRGLLLPTLAWTIFEQLKK